MICFAEKVLRARGEAGGRKLGTKRRRVRGTLFFFDNVRGIRRHYLLV